VEDLVKKAEELVEGYQVAIVDDSIAREVGEMLGIKVHGSLYLIFLMLRKGKIDKKLAKDKFDAMIRKGFRLSSEVYSEFLRLLKRF
jgi:predicted nucleic acid-binding protein